MSVWSWLPGFLDVCATYYSLLLIRCAAFSFVLAGVVLLFRKMCGSERVFLRSAFWGLFLLLPFLGKLKFFYENAVAIRMLWWLTGIVMMNRWIGRIYMLGVVAGLLYVLQKRRKIKKLVLSMEKGYVGGQKVFVTEMRITPFTTGLFAPRIVMPQMMMEGYSQDELEMIVQHEKTHIRLGHLWYYFTADVLGRLFWINPFMTVCQKRFHSDMEAICDRVCIQSSRRSAYEYGALLLKSAKLLCSSQESISVVAAYAGRDGFRELKRRVENIMAFRPYKKKACRYAAGIGGILFFLLFLGIKDISYGRCDEMENIIAYRGDGTLLLDNSKELEQIISYDDDYVYVDSRAFEELLGTAGKGQEIYIVFGGFQKLPGIGGGAYSCLYENAGGRAVARIPYEKHRDRWLVALYKLL